jgi:beta-glucosidase
MLAFHDSNLNLILEPGLIHVMLGSSSDDIRLRGEFEIVGETSPVHRRIFTCPVTVK